MSTNHAISRSVRDSAALLDATTGTEVGDPYAPPQSQRPFLQDLKHAPRQLRIALNLKRPDGTEPDESVKTAVLETAKLCEELGHIVVEAAPQLNPALMSEAQLTVSGAYVSLAIKQRGEVLGRVIDQSEVENLTWLISEIASSRSSVDLARSVQYIHKIGRLMECSVLRR